MTPAVWRCSGAAAEDLLPAADDVHDITYRLAVAAPNRLAYFYFRLGLSLGPRFESYDALMKNVYKSNSFESFTVVSFLSSNRPDNTKAEIIIQCFHYI